MTAVELLYPYEVTWTGWHRTSDVIHAVSPEDAAERALADPIIGPEIPEKDARIFVRPWGGGGFYPYDVEDFERPVVDGGGS